ncbi:MAG: formylglycine-generating enzyme family protein [Bacteroidales bacterium]|nr:formylglycine-generating enzyme family protein [Bacteroidales bacterium]MDD2424954.1 formylglycine-generating enzyme family protein [Bacteroidales bacterium]MDD3989106.1 formylglycine-generating enzyme family protein [Bacteroidales bacterium]
MKKGFFLFFVSFVSITLFAQTRPVIEWVSVPAGTFYMGAPAIRDETYKDAPRHQVTLSAFKMSKYEVTFSQYDKFCDATGRTKPNDQGWGRGNRPVIHITWDDAVAFAKWMGCRLPTEAEWEYACRAGTNTSFNTGGILTTAQANYNGTIPSKNIPAGEFRKRTLPVGSFQPNAWGLYDMHGNVREYCSDWYGAYATSAQTDPKGPSTGMYRVTRGGSWDWSATRCRSAHRSMDKPNLGGHCIGFRLVSIK